MDSLVLVNIALVLSAGVLATLWSRGAAVLLLLLPASQVLGLVRPSAIAAKGIVDVHLLLAVILFGLILCSLDRLHELSRARFLLPSLMLVGFWVYGVLYPLKDGGSTLFYSLKASKEFLTVVAYFAILLFLRTERDVRWGWRCLLGLGLYYSVLELAAQVMGERFLRQLTFDYQPEGRWFWKVFVSFWPVILLAFFHSFFAVTLRASRSYVSLVVGSFGLLLTFFRSYLLGAAGAIPLVLLLARRRLGSVGLQFALVGALLGTTILLAAFLAGGRVGSPGGMLDHFVLSGLREFQTQKGGSIEGREVFAQGRREILQQSPYTGYGFIEKDSKAGRRYQEHMIGDLLGFIDKGDLDTALKFGLVGRVVLYGTFAYLAWSLVGLAKQRLRPTLDARALAAAATIVVYLVVQPVHAPLTYSFGLLPLGIALGLIERERMLALGKPRAAQPAARIAEFDAGPDKRILAWSRCSILSRP